MYEKRSSLHTSIFIIRQIQCWDVLFPISQRRTLLSWIALVSFTGHWTGADLAGEACHSDREQNNWNVVKPLKQRDFNDSAVAIINFIASFCMHALIWGMVLYDANIAIQRQKSCEYVYCMIEKFTIFIILKFYYWF